MVSVKICPVAQDRKQGVNPDPSSNQDKVSRGICGLRVKEEFSTYSESHFRVKCALKQERKDPLVLCRASLRPNIYINETTGLTFCLLTSIRDVLHSLFPIFPELWDLILLVQRVCYLLF